MYREKGLSNYFYETKTGMEIDAGPMGNHTRFINHSCKPNCGAVNLAANEVTIVTDRLIIKGEELLLNYGKGYFKNITCLCKEDICLENNKKPLEDKKKSHVEKGFV